MRQVLCPRLVGRDDEMRRLASAIDDLAEGRGHTILLLGEAGVGKSRLAREADATARARGVRTLWGRALEGSSGTAYRPIAEALLSTLRDTPLPDAPQLKPFRPILGRLIPAWRDESSVPAEDSLVLFSEAVLRLLRVLGQDRGSLLVLEDLHWADSETLSVIDYLADNVSGEPVTVLATIRSDEPSPALALAASLQRRRASSVLDLPKLDAHAVRAMAEACLETGVPEAVARRLETFADGLPLLVEDLLAEWLNVGLLDASADALPEVVPLTFAQTIRRRMHARGEDATRLLRSAAVLGRRFDWRLLPLATGFDRQRTLELLRGAVDAQLVVAEHSADQATFRFRHALTQAAILGDLLPPERAELAARLGSIVETEYPGLPGETCELAARLAEQAGDCPRAASLLLEVGRRSLAAGALATAEATLDRARALAPDDSPLAASIDEALIEALALAGKPERALAIGADVLVALARAGNSVERQAWTHLRLARAALSMRDWQLLQRHLETARQAAPTVAPRADALAAQAAIEQGHVDSATALARRALDAARRHSLPIVACEALEVIGRAARRFDLDAAEAAFEQAQRIAEEHGLLVWRIRALHELGTIDLFRDACPGRLTQARELAGSCGALAAAAMIDVQLAAVYQMQFDLEASLEAARRAAQAGARFGLRFTRALGLAFQAFVHAIRMQRPEVEACSAEVFELMGERSQQAAEIWNARALCSLAEEDRPRTLRELDSAQQLVRDLVVGAPDPCRGVWALLRTLECQDGAAAREEVRRSFAMVQPINQAYLRYADAIDLGRSGRREDASRTAATGDRYLQGIPWYRHVGHRLLAEAAIQDGWGDPVSWLAEAVDFFERYGYERLASACRSLLRRCGVAIGRAHPALPPRLRAAGVSGREAEVLGLVGEGLTNKEIGTRLYLSPRTVERHIASLMAKLDVHTRIQLASFVAQH